jgi:hypothetical protein
MLILAGVAAALYLLWRAREKINAVIDDNIAAPIANAWLGLTQPDPVSVNARVRLPSGLMIDADEIHIESDQTFVYQKVRYRVTQRGADNVYVTVRA